MEKSMSLLLGIRDVFDCKPVDIRTYSPLTLAFVGDCVYDLVIRTVVAERGNTEMCIRDSNRAGRAISSA